VLCFPKFSAPDILFKIDSMEHCHLFCFSCSGLFGTQFFHRNFGGFHSSGKKACDCVWNIGFVVSVPEERLPAMCVSREIKHPP